MGNILMKCGCAAMGVCTSRAGHTVDPPIPVCITHECYEIEETPPILAGRKARCAGFGKGGSRHYECNYTKQTGCSPRQCRCELPSDPSLPFFEYLGPGSRNAKERCKRCRYFKSVHTPTSWHKCRSFEPIGDVGYDKFYCGCSGWD